MGRELPPDEVLACDQRICWWAGELRKAGLEGGMDELRARAFLDLVLGKDSRPRPDGTAAPAAGDSTGSSGSSGSDRRRPGAGDRASSGSGGSGGGNSGGGNSDGSASDGSASAAATVAAGRSSLPVRARRAAPGTAGRAGSPGGSR